MLCFFFWHVYTLHVTHFVFLFFLMLYNVEQFKKQISCWIFWILCLIYTFSFCCFFFFFGFSFGVSAFGFGFHISFVRGFVLFFDLCFVLFFIIIFDKWDWHFLNFLNFMKIQLYTSNWFENTSNMSIWWCYFCRRRRIT